MIVFLILKSGVSCGEWFEDKIIEGYSSKKDANDRKKELVKKAKENDSYRVKQLTIK